MSNQSSAPPQWVEDDRHHASLLDTIKLLDDRLATLIITKNGLLGWIDSFIGETEIRRDELYVELGEVKARMRITREAAEHATFDDHPQDKLAFLTLRAGILRLIEEHPGITQHGLYEKSGRHTGFYLALAKLQEAKKIEKLGNCWYTRAQRLAALIREPSEEAEIGCTCRACEYMRNDDNDGET